MSIVKLTNPPNETGHGGSRVGTGRPKGQKDLKPRKPRENFSNMSREKKIENLAEVLDLLKLRNDDPTLDIMNYSGLIEPDEKFIYACLIRGLTPTMIGDILYRYRIISTKTSAKNKVEDVFQRFFEFNKMDNDLTREIFIERYMYIYTKLIDEGKFKDAAGILDSVTKLKGLSAPQQVDLNVKTYQVKFE